ncbi:mercuric transporter MerT family protein [Nitratifractor sp.]
MKLDCRDLDCPVPVLRTKEALESIDEGILDVELNTLSSIENVKRFLRSQGLYFEEKKLGPRHVILSVVKGYECALAPDEAVEAEDDKATVPSQGGGAEAIQEAMRARQIAQAAQAAREDRKIYALLFGGIVSAILASTCCLGPLLFLLFGIGAGSLSFFKIFAPYHDLFVIAALIVVGYLWMDYFRKRRDKVACATSLCKNYLLYLILGTAFVAVMLSYPWWMGWLMMED